MATTAANRGTFRLFDDHSARGPAALHRGLALDDGLIRHEFWTLGFVVFAATLLSIHAPRTIDALPWRAARLVGTRPVTALR